MRNNLKVNNKYSKLSKIIWKTWFYVLIYFAYAWNGLISLNLRNTIEWFIFIQKWDFKVSGIS